MIPRLHDQIRTLIDSTPGLTQRGLAERMGLNPAAVNRMLYGRRNIRADEVPVIEHYLGVKLDLGQDNSRADYRQAMGQRGVRGFSDVASQAIEGHEGAMPFTPDMVPVYRDRRGSETIDWVTRHPLQLAVRDAYALYVTGDDMQPRYFRGETVYVHPAKPVMTGSDCVIEMKDGTVLLRRLAQKTADKLTVQQFQPSKLSEIALKDVEALYSIIGRA